MKSREFFNEDNTPEDPKLQKARELKAGERIAHNKKILHQMETWLGYVDFDVLEQMFQEDIQKTGISPAEINFLQRDRISSVRDQKRGDSTLGGHNPITNEIQVRYENIRQVASEYRLSSFHIFLYTLIHEETHAVSKTRCWNLSQERNQSALTQSGYRFVEHGQNESDNLVMYGDVFLLFNEGVTEKKSRKMTEEYLRRTGYRDDNGLTRVQNFFEEYSSSYNQAILVVEALTRRLAKANGISEEAAWGAIMRGYYEGENLLREDFQEWFGEILPPDFVDRLTIANGEDLAELLKELEETPPKKAA